LLREHSQESLSFEQTESRLSGGAHALSMDIERPSIRPLDQRSHVLKKPNTRTEIDIENRPKWAKFIPFEGFGPCHIIL
jgi:hypothetical protein